MTDFTTAKAYQIDGCDRYDTPEECLQYSVLDADGYISGTADEVASILKKMCPVTVHAYRLAERVLMRVDTLTDEWMTTFEEAYAADNLQLLDCIDELKDPRAYSRCECAIRDALADFERSLPVTRLESKPFASRTYSADEVVAILRELKPEWFREVANG